MTEPAERDLRRALADATSRYMLTPPEKDAINDRPLFQAIERARQALIDAGFKP